MSVFSNLLRENSESFLHISGGNRVGDDSEQFSTKQLSANKKDRKFSWHRLVYDHSTLPCGRLQLWQSTYIPYWITGQRDTSSQCRQYLEPFRSFTSRMGWRPWPRKKQTEKTWSKRPSLKTHMLAAHHVHFAGMQFFCKADTRPYSIVIFIRWGFRWQYWKASKNLHSKSKWRVL